MDHLYQIDHPPADPLLCAPSCLGRPAGSVWAWCLMSPRAPDIPYHLAGMFAVIDLASPKRKTPTICFNFPHHTVKLMHRFHTNFCGANEPKRPSQDLLDGRAAQPRILRLHQASNMVKTLPLSTSLTKEPAHAPQKSCARASGRAKRDGCQPETLRKQTRGKKWVSTAHTSPAHSH